MKRFCFCVFVINATCDYKDCTRFLTLKKKQEINPKFDKENKKKTEKNKK